MEREMEDEDYIGQGAIDHDARLLRVGSFSPSSCLADQAISCVARAADTPQVQCQTLPRVNWNVQYQRAWLGGDSSIY